MFVNCGVICIFIVSLVQIKGIIEFFFLHNIMYCMFIFELCMVYITTKLQKFLLVRLLLILHELFDLFFQFRLYVVHHKHPFSR